MPHDGRGLDGCRAQLGLGLCSTAELAHAAVAVGKMCAWCTTRGLAFSFVGSSGCICQSCLRWIRRLSPVYNAALRNLFSISFARQPPLTKTPHAEERCHPRHPVAHSAAHAIRISYSPAVVM